MTKKQQQRYKQQYEKAKNAIAAQNAAKQSEDLLGISKIKDNTAEKSQWFSIPGTLINKHPPIRTTDHTITKSASLYQEMMYQDGRRAEEQRNNDLINSQINNKLKDNDIDTKKDINNNSVR